MSRGEWTTVGVLAMVCACTPIERGHGDSAKASVEPAEAPAHVRPQGRVITTLQTRDHEVTVYVTDSGPRFTVAAAGGTVLAERLTDTEFRASFPGLHERYDSAFAEDGLGLDASAQRPQAATKSALPPPI